MERTEGEKKGCVIVSHCNESGEHFITHAQTLPLHWMMGEHAPLLSTDCSLYEQNIYNKLFYLIILSMLCHEGVQMK